MNTPDLPNEPIETPIENEEASTWHLKSFLINLTVILGICWGAGGIAFYRQEIGKYLWTQAADIRWKFECEEIIKQAENRVICIIKWGKATDGKAVIAGKEIASWRRWWDDKIVVIRNGKVIFEWTRWELAKWNTSCSLNVPITWDVWRGEKSMRDKIDECLGEVTPNK